MFRLGFISLALVWSALLAGDGSQRQTPAPGSAASGRWARLGTLGTASAIRVELTDGRRLAGTIEAFEPTRFALVERGNRVSVERGSIKRVQRKSRARGALYGFLTGFGAGFTAGAAAGPYIADFGNPGAARRVKYGIGLGMFGGGIGAGIGTLAGAKVTIYP